METSPSRTDFNAAYQNGMPPWVIGEPQPAVVALERAGRIRGEVLDPGCGTGEHTVYLTSLGYDVLGIDFSSNAVARARANAAARGVAARFEVADALRLSGEPRFDTVVDSALFHVFADGDRARYVHALHTVCRPGAVVHVLALSNVEPGIGPRISDTVIRAAFDQPGWHLQHLQPSRYRVMIDEEAGASLGLPAGEPADMIAWLATARRI